MVEEALAWAVAAAGVVVVEASVVVEDEAVAVGAEEIHESYSEAIAPTRA